MPRLCFSSQTRRGPHEYNTLTPHQKYLLNSIYRHCITDKAISCRYWCIVKINVISVYEKASYLNYYKKYYVTAYFVISNPHVVPSLYGNSHEMSGNMEWHVILAHLLPNYIRLITRQIRVDSPDHSKSWLTPWQLSRVTCRMSERWDISTPNIATSSLRENCGKAS